MVDEKVWSTLEKSTSLKYIFIDVDNTIMACNTGTVFAVYLFKRGLIRFKDIAVIPWHTLLYAFGFLDYSVVMQKAIKAWRGKTVSLLREEGLTCYREKLKHRYFSQSRSFIQSIRDKGYSPVLVSASPKELLLHLASDLGNLEVIATELEVENDFYTGEFSGPFCYGPGKKKKVQQWLEDRGESEAEYAAIGDSIADRELLESATIAIAAHADLRLKRVAQKSDWLTLDLKG